MQVEIKGIHINIGDALESHIKGSVETLKEKYFDRIIGANVLITKEKHLFQSEIRINVGRGILLKGSAEAEEPYPAFDGALDKLGKRLKKYKGKLRDHHNKKDMATVAQLVAKDYTIQADEQDVETTTDQDDPVIVAEMETIIEDLSVSEAVMRLELGDMTALMFRNRSHGEINMIYRREDGNIGWVDSGVA